MAQTAAHELRRIRREMTAEWLRLADAIGHLVGLSKRKFAEAISVPV
jgi:hypothetical protein